MSARVFDKRERERVVNKCVVPVNKKSINFEFVGKSVFTKALYHDGVCTNGTISIDAHRVMLSSSFCRRMLYSNDETKVCLIDAPLMACK